MTKLKAIASNIKYWIAFAALIFGSLVALGATIDRPAWISELTALAQQVARNDATLSKQVASNDQRIEQIEIDRVQRRVWAQEDRQKTAPTSDGAQRLRELQRQLKRLEEKARSK